MDSCIDREVEEKQELAIAHTLQIYGHYDMLQAHSKHNMGAVLYTRCISSQSNLCI